MSRLAPMAWMPLRTGFSAPIILMCSTWLLSVLTRKARALPCQGSDLQMALSLLASQLCLRNPWLTLLRRSSDLQFQWEKRRYHLCTGSGFSLLVSLSVSPNAGLRMVVVRVALPAGLCLVSQTSLLVCAMLGQTLFVQLDFCRKSFSDSVPLTKLPHCRMQSYNLLCVASCVEIAPGQPFRLHLLRILANDPDSAFTDQLAAGVSLGVQCHLQPCRYGPGLPPDVDPRPLGAARLRGSLLCPTCLLWTTSSKRSFSKVGLRKSLAGYLRCATNRSCVPCPTCDGLPVGAAREDLTGLVLDMSKAHRRIKVRPQDQGLLCFHHRGKLFQCLTLNFGARASSYYWARAAGLLCRLLHRIIYVNHGLMIYVDDLLCLLRKCTSPLLAALLVVFLLILKVPMSWRKASLSSHPVWIGWSIDLTTITVCVEADKQQRLLQLLLSILEARRVSRHDVERLTGKLL